MRRTYCRQEKVLQLVGKDTKPIFPGFKSLINFLSSREICELNSLGIEIMRTKGVVLLCFCVICSRQ